MNAVERKHLQWAAGLMTYFQARQTENDICEKWIQAEIWNVGFDLYFYKHRLVISPKG